MSLSKKRKTTTKGVAASQSNGKGSRGPSTSRGRERIRAAHLRHGFYSEGDEVALRALGEDPAQFQELLERLWEKWDPTDALQEELVDRLARALWRMKRADRMQEGYALRQAREMCNGREDRLHAQMMRLQITASSFRKLAESVSREHYVTTPDDLELIMSLHQEGAMKESAEVVVALFCQLEAPESPDADEVEEVETSSGPDAKTRGVLVSIREIFGLGTSPADMEPFYSRRSSPTGEAAEEVAGVAEDDVEEPAALENDEEPNFTAEEWESREPVRQLLENILKRQVELYERQRQVNLLECLKGPSRFERAAEIAPTHRDEAFMRRMEDSQFRQVWRITALLMKVKQREREEEDLENIASEPGKFMKGNRLSEKIEE